MYERQTGANLEDAAKRAETDAAKADEGTKDAE
jgi:hypothetical protein